MQENMIESQTLKPMIHEVAHSMLHNKEVEQDEQARKDRNTKEVEALPIRCASTLELILPIIPLGISQGGVVARK